jgi:ribosomal protein L37E
MNKNFISNGKSYMVYCPKCGKENWAPAVSSSQCVWCGYKEEIGNDIQRTEK